MKLVYQYVIIFFLFKATSNHLHSLQVENCNSNSRLIVVDEDDYSEFRPERVDSCAAAPENMSLNMLSKFNHIMPLQLIIHFVVDAELIK